MPVATYSISPGSTQEAVSKSAITGVLSLLPDNTSKDITPRDIRDAIFSTWESSVIRYTSNGTTDYIGIDRNSVKNIKIVLGKKEISGVNIVSNASLLSSDTDIFLYNTKSDSAATQNFKMSLLAGSNTGLFTSAPYISSTFVSSAGAIPAYLSMGLINPATYGTVTIQSGSSASTTINNLKFPSTTYVNSIVTGSVTAQGTDINTFVLATRSNGEVELLTLGSLGGSIGATGSPTNIFGTPVNINGFPIEYTNSNPIITPIGGISKGTTFSNVPIVTLLTQLLYPYSPPSVGLIITTSLGSNSSLERNHNSTTTISYQYTLIKTSNNITSTQLKTIRNGTIIYTDSLSTISGSGTITQTFNDSRNLTNTNISSVVNQNLTITFSVVPTDGTSTATASQRINFVYPYYYGYSATNVTNASGFNGINLTDLTKRVDIYASQSVAISGTGYLYFAYPSYYGVLVEIKDGNNYIEYSTGNLTAWTYSLYSSISGSNWSGANYYVFKKINTTTTSPTQTYKFNF